MWHIDAEIISLIFMFVIIIDIFKINALKTLKDQLFGSLAVITVCSILIDIISSSAMMNYRTVPWWLIQYSLLLYFVLTPMLSMLWQLYSIALVSEDPKVRKKSLIITAIPFGIYMLIVISNPYTAWLFELSSANEYTRGVLFNSIYLIFYGYSLSTLLLAFINFKKMERTTSIVLTIFPVIAGLGIFIQQILPGYLITGAAFTLVLLITYIFLQNRKATRDSLTGLNNRLSFSSTIDAILKSNESGFTLTASIDDFKLFNQTFGQKAGDKLLCKIAEYFVSISPNKMVYRYSGDIFALILMKINEDEVSKLVSSIMERFKNHFYMDDVDYSVSICLGVVEFPDCSKNQNCSTISAMDFAIYAAKKRGKGQVAFFNDTLVKQFWRKNEIIKALIRAMEKQCFEVYIQPIYHMSEKRFLFAEALLRLNDDVLGFVSPSEFIPIAEETGKIVEITYFVLEKVCAFLKDNRDILHDEVSISVNFSVIQFMQSNMAEKIIEIIESYGISPSLIKIEVTESVIADSFDDIKIAMQKLSEYGISFALDDYGQGYSNISYLINLPFTIVKLDKSIIDNIATDKTFISALIPMFKKLNKVIISEGVEEKVQVDVLDNLLCDAIQGYYFARPMTMDKALEVFDRMPTIE